MSLIEKMSDEQLFTNIELTVVHYMKENLDKVIHMSIQELAKQTYSSNSTIIRICKKLGMAGFRRPRYRRPRLLSAGGHPARKPAGLCNLRAGLSRSAERRLHL